MIDENAVLTLRKFSKLINVAPSTLTFWEQRGLIVPRKTATGKKYFIGKDVLDYLNNNKSRVFPNGANDG